MIQLIIQNWIGLLIGLGVAALLCLLVCTKIENKVGASILSIILVLVCAFGGSLIQNYFFTIRDKNSLYYDVIKDPTIEVVNPDDFLNINSNGGFDRNYIVKELETAETTEDKNFTINMAEYKEIVIFYYDTKVDNENYTVNIIMNKVNDSLAFDGCINIYVKKTGALWWTKHEYINQMYIGNNFAPLTYALNTVNSPLYYSICFEPARSILVNDRTVAGRDGTACKVAQIGNLGVYNQYFQQLGDLGLMLTEDNICRDMNGFYTSVYKSTKNSDMVNPSLDVTNSCAYYNADEEAFYKCNLFLNVNYKNYSSTSAFAVDMTENKKYEDELKYNVATDVLTYSYTANVKFYLTPKQTYNMSSFDITKAPVKIILTNSDYNYEIIFDTYSELTLGIAQNIHLGTYALKIESNVLDLGDIGTVNITKDTGVIQFKYNYEYGTILTSIKLYQLSNLDLTGIDLATNPVTITLNNGTSSYNFIYDTLDKLKETISKRLPMGKYNYSIVSNELAFSETSGTLTIDVNNYSFIFKYDYKTNIEYELDVKVCMDTELPNILLANKFGFWVDSVINMPDSAGMNLKQVVLYDTFNEVLNTYELYQIECENDNRLFYGCDFPYIDDLENYMGTHYYQIQLVFEDDTVIVTNILEQEFFVPVNETFSSLVFYIE